MNSALGSRSCPPMKRPGTWLAHAQLAALRRSQMRLLRRRLDSDPVSATSQAQPTPNAAHGAQMKGKRSNRERLMSATPNDCLTGDHVWAVLEAAEGRCAHCRSPALENRPSKPNDAPAPCESVGRRINSRGHVVARFNSDANTPDKLA